MTIKFTFNKKGQLILTDAIFAKKMMETLFLKGKDIVNLQAEVVEEQEMYSDEALGYFWAEVAQVLFTCMRDAGYNVRDKHAAVEYGKILVGFVEHAINPVTGEVIGSIPKSLKKTKAGKKDLNWLTEQFINLITQEFNGYVREPNQYKSNQRQETID
jgi:hypothetical protein